MKAAMAHSGAEVFGGLKSILQDNPMNSAQL
jgi:hypothetical protein